MKIKKCLELRRDGLRSMSLDTVEFPLALEKTERCATCGYPMLEMADGRCLCLICLKAPKGERHE